MIETLEQLDRDLFLLLNSPHTDLLDTVMWYSSTTWLWIPLYLIMLYFAFKKGQLKFALTILGGVLLCVLLADLTSVHLFKNVFLRYRPTHNLEIMDLVKTVKKPNGQEYLGGQFGFVSSHAANIGAIATFILFSFTRFSKKWLFLIIWAALVMYSRIYLGVHYPGDILGGALLGFVIGFSIFKLSSKLNLQPSVK
ncbi:MAG: phosphatase PAP2 family protein [Crocinitomicaceae bacterium]